MMTEKYIIPSVDKEAFHCPHCGAYAKQRTSQMKWSPGNGLKRLPGGVVRQCSHCNDYTLWLNDKLVYPDQLTAPRPHEMMPDNIERDFTEARNVLDDSPRAAAALLRLAIQRLLEDELDAEGSSLYQMIGNLVEQGEISPRIQKALDSVRIIGNNSVHPGEMNMDDDKEMAEALFMLTNEIIDEAMARDARIDQVYDSLPEGPKEGVERRDSK